MGFSKPRGFREGIPGVPRNADKSLDIMYVAYKQIEGPTFYITPPFSFAYIVN